MTSKLREAIYGEIGRLCEIEVAFNGNLPEHQKRIDNSTDAIIDAVIETLPKEVYEGENNDAHDDHIAQGHNRLLEDVKSILLEAKEK